MMAASLYSARANDSSPSVSFEAYRQHIRGTTVAANDGIHRQGPDTLGHAPLKSETADQSKPRLHWMAMSFQESVLSPV
jgi:hypothetical protein